jgi:hypothetical protein
MCSKGMTGGQVRREGSIAWGGVPIRVAFIQSDLEQFRVCAAGRLGGGGWRRLPLGGCERRGRGWSPIWGRGGGGAGAARIGGDVRVAVVCVNKKTSKAASPPLKVRMGFGKP